MFAFRAHALLADDAEFVGKARRGESLPPNVRGQVLRAFQRDVAGGKAAVGKVGLGQVVFIQQAAHGFFEGRLKAGDVVSVYGQAGCHRVSAEFQNQVGMAFGYQIQRVAQVQLGDGASRTAHFAVVRRGEDDGGAVETVFQTACHDADYALVEVVAVNRQRGLPERQCFGEARQRVVEHGLFDFAPFDVEVVQLCRQRLCRCVVVGQKAGDADGHIVQPSGGIDARAQRKTHVERLRLAPVAPCRVKQGADARAHLARPHPFQSLRY